MAGKKARVNKVRIARKQASFLRGQEKKELRKVEQDARASHNKSLKKDGELTAWQKSKAARKAKRASESN